MRWIVGLIVLALLVLVAFILEGGYLKALFHPSSLAIVLGAGVGGLLMAAGSRSGAALSAPFSRGAASEVCWVSRHALRAARLSALSGGIFACVVGIVATLSTVE